ncbi:ubinuclein-1-like isoform X2 [Argentina anserina]|uniref:ubinuclein-1-like isoform X2 n=1 Tax=Argentina anserina TaxID=57926 RepID=UPI0021762196|nr:ubinuclein-1-like isoform X2 [Potentilla anserina]
MDDPISAAESSRPSTSVLKSGDRQMFTVDLRPGETTIVSWKKLVKDTNKHSGLPPVPAPEPPANAHPSLESRIAPVQVQPSGEGEGEGEEGKDEAAPNRFSAVIEKIERLYMGKDSSDDEDQNIPDDDQYDTEDSFIDDAELDEYFEVDNSAIKHDGFFVNRGQLERINTTAALPNQQPKKRRRKDAKNPGENHGSLAPNRQAKLGKTAGAKMSSALGLAKSSSALNTIAVTTEHRDDMKFQNSLNACGYSPTKKSVDSNSVINPSPLKALDRDASGLLGEVKDIDKPKSGSLLHNDSSNRFKDAGASSDASYHKYHDKSAYSQTKIQSGRLSSNADELESSVRARVKNGIRQLPDLNLSDGKYSVPTTKTSHVHRKEGSSVRPKGSMLEKAIRELERMVAESRPPAMDNVEGDNSSQAIKRRLPREIKMKLAKVARLAANNGKISKELLNRLMSSLGHLIQLRTLKRNLKIMINTGLSAKKEKDDRFQQIKKEVIDMVKTNASFLESKALEQQAGASDDFQEIASGAKDVSKRKFSMDPVLEDKICDLYDLYADGLDEDIGPQIRKLYAELAALWPSGLMDNHGIKSAICRAKDRRRERYSQNKDQEKMRRKKMLTPKVEESVRVEASSVPQQLYMRERLATEPGSHGSGNKPVSGTTAAVRIPSPINGPSFDRLKQEKLKGSASNSPDDTRVGDGAMIKKKVKRKPEQELDETRIRPDKLPSQQGDERQKPLKQAAGVPHKSNHQSTGLPSVEQSS